MAHVTGTATDYNDFWSKFLDFLQNNADLVAAGQAWTIAWQAPAGTTGYAANDVVLKGPGSGEQDIYVGMRMSTGFQTTSPSTEAFIALCGCTGVLSTATNYKSHLNPSPVRPAMFLDGSDMKYWFTANGRHFAAVVQMSTVYQAMYGGFFLPFASPDTYGYPLFVGGSVSELATNGYVIPSSWRTPSTITYNHFAQASSYYCDSTGAFLAPDGTWRQCVSYGGPTDTGGTINPSTSALPGYMAPRLLPNSWGPFKSDAQVDTVDRQSVYGNSGIMYETFRRRLVSGLDGEACLTRITLMDAANAGAADAYTPALGVLDGCFQVALDSPSAEDIVTVDGVDHLIVQNVDRTSTYEYWALALD